MAVNIQPSFLDFFLHAGNLRLEVDLSIAQLPLDFLELFFQLQDRLFKFERLHAHLMVTGVPRVVRK